MVLWKNSDADIHRQYSLGKGKDDCGVSGGKKL
jgi:hypothetical protein